MQIKDGVEIWRIPLLLHISELETVLEGGGTLLTGGTYLS